MVVENTLENNGSNENLGLYAGMILGAKFRSWANFPWFFQNRDSLF